MSGEAKVLIVLAAIAVSAFINVTAEHFLGWQVRTGTGMIVGALLIRMWPSFAGLQRKGADQ